MERNYHQLWVFMAVARNGSFSKAAEELFISQPAVSAQVKELEKSYGTPLFQQLGRKVYLTEAGENLYHYAERAFALIEEGDRIIDGLKGLERGHLVVAASTTPGTYLVPSLLGKFRQCYPGIRLTLKIGSSEIAEGLVVGNKADLGFVGKKLSGDDLEYKPYKSDRLVVIASPSHPLVTKDRVSMEELLLEPFIVREPGSATRSLTEAGLREMGLSLEPAMELGSPEAVKQAVAAGLGLAVVSEHSISWELAAGRFSTLRVEGLSLERKLYLMYLRRKTISPAADALLKLIEEEQE